MADDPTCRYCNHCQCECAECLTPAMADDTVVTRTVDCPECHQYCNWCSWYRKNAREVGCGSQSKRKCAFGQAAKGVPCSMCDGSGRVTATTTYSRSETR